MTDEIKEESRRHDCPIGGISITVLSEKEARREDEQELIEKIAKLLHTFGRGEDWEALNETQKSYSLNKANQFLALIKEALPELAKEAGYVKSPVIKSDIRPPMYM